MDLGASLCNRLARPPAGRGRFLLVIAGRETTMDLAIRPNPEAPDEVDTMCKPVLCSALVAGAVLTALPHTAVAQATTNFPVIGTIHRNDPQLDELIPKDAKIEVLSSRFKWAEGPIWVKDGGFLLFSDVIANQVMKWKEGEGVSVYLRPSGYTGLYPYSKEPGSNGLTLDSKGRLCSCEHGDRRVSVLTVGGGKRTLVDNYQGKRLNSPNDLCFKIERRPVFHRSALRPAEAGRRSDARTRLLRCLPAVA